MTDIDPNDIDPTEVEVRDAATVMLVRDASRGPEVFLLQRNPSNVFVGGAYVFPGGAVDPEDRDTGLEAFCAGLTDRDASAALGLEGGGLAFWVAAIRECFEECGILLAYDRDGRPLRFDDPPVAERFAEHRARVDQGDRLLADVCGAEGLTLATDRLGFVSRWITPEGPPRRYDTRFFVAPAPSGQVGTHDGREAVADVWMRPADAIARAAAGEIPLIEPTLANLDTIARFGTTDEVLAGAPDPSPIRIPLPGESGIEGAAS